MKKLIEIKCPEFDKAFPISPLNPDICVAPGKCNYCPMYKKECKGCKKNLIKKKDENKI